MLTPILYCPQYCRNVSFVDNVVAALMFCTLGDILPAQDEGRVFWVVSAHRPSQGGSRIIPLETTLWDVIKGDDTAPYLFTELIGGAPKPKTPPVDHRSPYRTRHAAGRESMETHLDASTTPTSTPLPSAPPLVQLQAATTPHYHDDGDDHDDNNDEDNGDQAVNDDEVRLEVPYCVEKTPEERMNDAQQLLGVGFNLPESLANAQDIPPEKSHFYTGDHGRLTQHSYKQSLAEMALAATSSGCLQPVRHFLIFMKLKPDPPLMVMDRAVAVTSDTFDITRNIMPLSYQQANPTYSHILSRTTPSVTIEWHSGEYHLTNARIRSIIYQPASVAIYGSNACRVRPEGAITLQKDSKESVSVAVDEHGNTSLIWLERGASSSGPPRLAVMLHCFVAKSRKRPAGASSSTPYELSRDVEGVADPPGQGASSSTPYELSRDGEGDDGPPGQSCSGGADHVQDVSHIGIADDHDDRFGRSDEDDVDVNRREGKAPAKSKEQLKAERKLRDQVAASRLEPIDAAVQPPRLSDIRSGALIFQEATSDDEDAQAWATRLEARVSSQAYAELDGRNIRSTGAVAMVDGHETFVKKSITSKEKREGKDTLARTGLEVVRSGRCDNNHLWFLCGADD